MVGEKPIGVERAYEVTNFNVPASIWVVDFGTSLGDVPAGASSLAYGDNIACGIHDDDAGDSSFAGNVPAPAEDNAPGTLF